MNAYTEAEQAEAEKLAKEYAKHAAAAQPHLDRMEEIKARYREILDYGTHKAGNLNVGISRNSRFNPDAFAMAYPPELNPQMYKLVPDPDAIPPNLKDGFLKHGSARVSIK